jgi:hypothetical protein
MIFNVIATAKKGDYNLRKKGIAIWLFSSLTVISLIHLIDAASSLIFSNPTQILQLYPFLGQQLQQIPIEIYLYTMAASTAILWGITCLIAFDNPVEDFLNKVLSDAKRQSTAEAEILEGRSEMLDLIYESIESEGEKLAQVHDLIRNVRVEVKDIEPVKKTVEKTRIEVNKLKREVETLEEKLLFNIVCPACGKLLRADFKLCPYCGECTTLQEKIIAIKDHK